ncbi:MAG: hypothetical protein V3V81_08065 [Candidatus Bathyarchaeia archaeon]
MDILPWMKGFGSEGSVLNLMLTAFIIWHVFLKPKLMKKQGKDRRKVGNPHDKPGDGIACKENRDKLVKLEEKVGNVVDDIKEMKKDNRDDHRLIFSKIDKIRNNK